MRPRSSERKPRTDAQRNRERILEVANEAGVGPGTLYRHFPTRDQLLEAVYRTEVGKLAVAERKFSEAMSPIEALRAWMLFRGLHRDQADRCPCSEYAGPWPLETI